MTQSQWMKGCPEGGEQGFLFSLYSQLVEGHCPCPSSCGYSVPRAKSHFFAIFVSGLLFWSTKLHFSATRPLSTRISSTSGGSFVKPARNVPKYSVLHAASQSMGRKFWNQRKPRMTVTSSIAPICKASSSGLVLRCLSSYIMTNFRTHYALRTRSERASVGRQIQRSVLR